jgi:DNA repair protein RadC
MPYLKRKSRRLTRAIIDFTEVDTVYKKRPLKTIQLRIDRVLLTTKTFDLETLGDPEDICEILGGIFNRLDDDQEHLVLLTLDPSGNVKGFKVISSGTMESIVIDQAIIYRNALLLGAAFVVLAHNHPDGTIEPSYSDLKATVKLARIGHDLRIPLIDHIIFTPSKCISIHRAYPHLFKEPFEDLKG